MSNHNEIMNNLKNSLYEMTKYIKFKKIIYIDYPTHHNIGDLLIYLGAMELLKESGIEVLAQFTATNANVEKVQKLITENNNEVSIVFHGGGNFGDIYEAHQNCRLLFIEHFPLVNTIIFPQTIFYKNEVKKINDIKIFQQHKDLTIVVRDSKSEAIAKGFCNNVLLYPDTAHMLWKGKVTPILDDNFSQNKLKLNRWDCEGLNEKQKSDFDWPVIINKSDLYFKSIIRRVSSINTPLLVDKCIAYLWEKHCINLCQRAAKYFNQYAEIETNRLHGHILSCLITKKHTVIDNSYGKNFTYLEQWTKGSDLVVMQTQEEKHGEK